MRAQPRNFTEFNSDRRIDGIYDRDVTLKVMEICSQPRTFTEFISGTRLEGYYDKDACSPLTAHHQFGKYIENMEEFSQKHIFNKIYIFQVLNPMQRVMLLKKTSPVLSGQFEFKIS